MWWHFTTHPHALYCAHAHGVSIPSTLVHCTKVKRKDITWTRSETRGSIKQLEWQRANFEKDSLTVMLNSSIAVGI